MTKGKRKLAWLGLFCLIGAGLTFASLPLWLPWILPLTAHAFSLDFRSYQRNGYSRAILRDLIYRRGPLEIRAERLETSLPAAWIIPFKGSRQVKVEGWTLTVSPSPKTSRGKGKIQSTWDLVALLDRQEPQLRKWLVQAELKRGEIKFKGKSISVPELAWSNYVLRASILYNSLPGPVRLSLVRSPSGRWEMRGTMGQVNAQGWLQSSPANLNGEARFDWQRSSAQASFSFAQQGWLPSSGRIETDQVSFPLSWLSRQGYRPITAKLKGIWDGSNLRITGQAQAQPAAAFEQLPSFTTDMAGVADLNRFVLEKVTVRSPGFDLHLNDQAELFYQPPYLRTNVAITAQAELDLLPWRGLGGKAQVAIEIQPGREKYPVVTVKGAGSPRYQEMIEFRQVDLLARLEWPWLELQKVTAITASQANGFISGRYNLAQGQVEDGQLLWTGIPEARWLPEQCQVKKIELKTRFAGPWRNPYHQGTLQLDSVQIKASPPARVEMQWKGTAGLLSEFKSQASWGVSSIRWEGRGGWHSDRVLWTNSVLNLEQSGLGVLKLEKPAALEWARAKDRAGWRLQTDPMAWSGKAGEIRIASQLNWPQTGTLDLSVLNLRLREFAPDLPPLQFDLVRANARWDHSPLAFQLELNGSYQPNLRQAPFRALAKAEGDLKGLHLERVEVLQGQERALSIQGVLPVHFGPGHKRWMEIDESGELSLEAQSYPRAGLWQQLEEQAGLVIRNPDVKLAIHGTAHSPVAQGVVQIGELRQTRLSARLPSLRDFQAELKYDGKRLDLLGLRGLVEGQPFRARGQIPWYPGEPWRSQLNKAQGEFVIDSADMTPLLQPWTNLFIPQGRLSLNLVLEQGLNWGGRIEVRGLESRPLAAMGALQDIHLVGKVQGLRLIISEGGASIGGDAVRLLGQLDWSQAEAGLPLFDLRLQAAEVPIARRPDLILRSGFDLALRHEAKKPVTISGQVRLTNSVYLSDIELLIPGKVAAPDRRPPYFSITNRPIAGWALDIEIQGDRFIRIRSPIFRGAAGLRAQLRGTLQEPVLLGTVTIPAGFIQFPFGNLEVRQGTVSLTSDNPYQPKIDLRAAARVFGYEVQMSVRGSIQEPIIEFTSIPGLSSEQVVLMLTAGELPQQEIRFTGRQRAAHLGLFVGKSLLSQLSEDSSVSDRLMIYSGQDVTSEGRQTYLVEYRWSENWSLVAEYDRFGDYNGGVKWRFYSK